MFSEEIGIIYLILFILTILVGLYYSYDSIINTKNWLAKYGVDESGAALSRFAGSQILGVTLVGTYILFKGATGMWLYFAVAFVINTCCTLTGLYTIFGSDLRKKEGVEYTNELWIVPGILAIITAVIIYGIQDIIYT